MYAEKKEWPLRAVAVRLRHECVHAQDCADCETESGMLDEIHMQIRVEGDLDEAQRECLMSIAQRCPVHRTLTSEVKIRTVAA